VQSDKGRLRDAAKAQAAQQQAAAQGSSAYTLALGACLQVDGRLMMHGGQEGRSWAAIIQGDTGRLSAGVVDHEGGFLIFGTCTTP
jgi:hypothetical protein